MNVYPIELIAQYAPLMFVAGLTEGNQAPQSPSSSSPTNSNKTHSPIESPQLMSEGSSLSGKSDDPFESLIARLRAILVRRRKDTVWDTERDGSFQAILVKKNILIPPPKVQPTFLRRYGTPLVPNYGDTHSPLSPLTPSSPLYPDGLISPVWIRKHVELIPSVFMLFLRLSEMPTMALSLEGRQEAEQEARKRDAELVMEILQRKKSTSERGIKLIIVLLTSRRMLEDLSLDARLSFIRRQSSLDARQSLFVLTPVSDSELLDFVKNLQSVVYGAAKNYYAAHSARVQRKRRIQPRANANEDLREIGWIMRYEYKLALFAEFRMEVELARKHYEDCWLALEEMFGSTAILPPRTKRWVEAKLTADCVAFKLCKLYLYSDECSMAMSVFNRHIHKISALARGWGIGDETFEFWGWRARQYQLLAELLELALQAGFKIPPTRTPTAAALGAASNMVGCVDETKGHLGFSTGLNPANVLQHPGYYYYAAAKCTLQRYERFLTILKQETARPGPISHSPVMTNEKRLKHRAMAIELYVKAYELFDKFRIGLGRQTMYIIYRVAEMNYVSGNFDAAIRFFEKLASMYRREQWSELLRPILSMWYDCARQSGNIELTIKLLIEIMGSNVVQGKEERASLPDDLVTILKKSPLPSPESSPLTVDLPESSPLFNCNAVFWRSDVSIGEPAPFQLFIASPSDLSLSSLPITSLRIYFGEAHSHIIVSHTAKAQSSDDVKRVNVGHALLDEKMELNAEATLRWKMGQTQVFAGTVTSMVPNILKVSKVVFALKEGDWTIEIPIAVHPGPDSTFKPRLALAPPRWLSSLSGQPAKFISIYRTNSYITNVHSKRHGDLHQEQLSSASMQEQHSIQTTTTNNDEQEPKPIRNAPLQPSDDESKSSFKSCDSTSPIDFSQLDLGSKVVCGTKIQRGGYSDVFEGTLDMHEKHTKVAIKALRVHGQSDTKESDERLRRHLHREISLWWKLQHSNIVPLLGYMTLTDGSPALISPWYVNGSIVRYLEHYPNAERPSLVLDIINGLEYLHSIPMAHGDLKGENVLVDADGHASLCDFGMSHFLDTALRITGFTTSNAGYGGTDRYMCPELFENEPKSIATDVWALGCLIVQILTDEMPYQNISSKPALMRAILRGDLPMTNRNGAIAPSLWTCIKTCWSVNPKDRPKVLEIGNYLKSMRHNNVSET